VSREKIIWLAVRGILVVMVGLLSMSCATSTSPVVLQQPQETQKKSVLETCAVVQDKDLAEMRGCYDVYSFAMSITGDLDLASRKFSMTSGGAATFNPAVNGASAPPSQLTISNGGSQVSFSNSNVAYNAGIGNNSLGSGIMQVVQVSGVNVMVMASLEVNLNITNSIGIKSTASNVLPGALSGIIR
jgi:hypothetical protein